MNITARAICTQVFQGKRAMYYTFTDIETGGQFSLAVDGKIDKVDNHLPVVIDVVVSPSIYAGKMTLKYLEGSIVPA